MPVLDTTTIIIRPSEADTLLQMLFGPTRTDDDEHRPCEFPRKEGGAPCGEHHFAICSSPSCRRSLCIDHTDFDREGAEQVTLCPTCLKARIREQSPSPFSDDDDGEPYY